jgi:hypothetical protein
LQNKKKHKEAIMIFDQIQKMIDFKKFFKSHESQLSPHTNVKASDSISYRSFLSDQLRETSPQKSNVQRHIPSSQYLKSKEQCMRLCDATLQPFQTVMPHTQFAMGTLKNPFNTFTLDNDYSTNEMMDHTYIKLIKNSIIHLDQTFEMFEFLENELKKMWMGSLRRIHLHIQCEAGVAEIFLTFHKNNEVTARFVSHDDDMFDFLLNHKEILEKILNTSPLKAQSYDIVFVRY